MINNDRLKEIISAIQAVLTEKGRATVAIDGRCAAGKTTLAARIARELDCNVFHMDDFFLRPEQRSEERLKKPGENVDHERFLSEVLEPVSRGEGCVYRPFSCKTQSLSEPIKVEFKSVSVVEGSYSCHEKLSPYYDLRVFLDVDPEEQLRRIEERGGREKLQDFKRIWIPLEEAYFEAYSIADRCRIYIKT